MLSTPTCSPTYDVRWRSIKRWIRDWVGNLRAPAWGPKGVRRPGDPSSALGELPQKSGIRKVTVLKGKSGHHVRISGGLEFGGVSWRRLLGGNHFELGLKVTTIVDLLFSGCQAAQREGLQGRGAGCLTRWGDRRGGWHRAHGGRLHGGTCWRAGQGQGEEPQGAHGIGKVGQICGQGCRQSREHRGGCRKPDGGFFSSWMGDTGLELWESSSEWCGRG